MNHNSFPPNNEKKRPMSRREFVYRMASILGITATASYLFFAPEEFPFSRKDFTGRRSQPRPRRIKLPDFRVDKSISAVAAGVGRGDTVEKRLRKALDAIGGISHYILPGDTVLIKPNVAFDRSPGLGATTHPAIIEELIKILRIDCRAREVRVADNPIESPADCFAKSGIRMATERAGGRIYLPDGNAFRVLETPQAVRLKTSLFFYRPFKNVTKVIGVAAVKDHNLCQASLGMKNWYGLLGGQRNQFHQDIHETISDFPLMLPPTLTILDGSVILMKNGPTGGNLSDVKQGDAIVAGTDPVAIDAWAFRNLLEREGDLPGYLYRAEQKGCGRIEAIVREVV